MTENDGFTPAVADIGSANAAVDKFFGPGTVEIPKMEGPDSEEVILPAGLLKQDGQLVTKAYVRELTGRDEEALAKAADNPSRYYSILLERGVTMLGEEKPTKSMFQDLLTGDRAALVLGIRIATYGEELETRAFCAFCEEWVEITLSLKDDVKIKPLENPTQRNFEVPLRKGGKAEVTLVDGAIEEKVMASSKLDGAQRDTLILSQCVRSINGLGVLGRTDPVLSLGIADRKALLDFMGTKLFGPDYSSISFEHDVCGKEVPVAVSAGDLFRI